MDSPIRHHEDWKGRRVLVRTYGQPSHPPIWWAGTVVAARRWRLRPPSQARPKGKLGESPVLLLVQPLRGRGSQWVRTCRVELVEDWPLEPAQARPPLPLGDQAIPDLWSQRQAILRAKRAKREERRQKKLALVRANQGPTPTIPSSGREIESGL